MRNELDIALEEAIKGREIWIKLIEKHKLENNFRVVLMPSDDIEMNMISLDAVKQLAESTTSKIVVLSFDKFVLDYEINRENVIIEEFSRKDAEALMRFYCMYEFTDKLIIASLDEPEGRMGKGLIGVKGITKEELIKVGVFKIM